MSVPRVILEAMQLTEADLARIPRTNLRVPVDEFARVWQAAETLDDDWYEAGVAVTCRWLAAAIVRPSTGSAPYPATAPVTKTGARAYEELIQAECVAADKLAMRQPRPAWLQNKPGWSEGICATLHWAWLHDRPAPLAVGQPAPL